MKPTKDRTKLNAVWLPADVIRDKHHERECTYSRVIHYDDGSSEVDESCICDRLRACQQRERDLWERVAAERIRDLMSCHKPDDCHARADSIEVLLADVEYFREERK